MSPSKTLDDCVLKSLDCRAVKTEQKEGQDCSLFFALTVVTASWLTLKLTVEVAMAMVGLV